MRIRKKVKTENNVIDIERQLKYALSEDYETYTKTKMTTVFWNYKRTKLKEKMYIGSEFLGCEFRDTSDGDVDFYVEVDKKPNDKKRDDVFNKKIYKIIDNVIEKMAVEAYNSYLYKKHDRGYIMSDPECAVSHSQVPIFNSDIVFWQTTEIFIKKAFNNTSKREKALARKSDYWHNIEERKQMLPNLINFLNCFLEGDEITEKYVVDKATEKFKEKIKEEKER